jgi:hypothetical protein
MTDIASILADGRQSARALEIRRGVQRHLLALTYASLPEVTLASGRRVDLLTLGPRGDIWIIEIKSSLEDLRADRKWPLYRPFCDALFFATRSDVDAAAFPVDAGLLVADGHGAHVLRDAPLHPLPAARRKTMHLLFGRCAADRLLLLHDPLARNLDI